MTGLFSVSIVAGIFVGMLILIGVFVYRDAKKRNMNFVAWTAIAVLTPALVGFIAYLIVSRSIAELKCPRCETTVTDKYVICPVCSAKLKPLCPSCAAPVETHWKNCPMCTKPLDGSYNEIVSPKAPKDNVLRNILIVIILVPLLFIAFVLISSSVSGSMSVGYSSITSEMTVEEFLELNSDERVESWLNEKEYNYNPNCAYALEYTEGEQYYYLIYVPRAGEGSINNFEIEEYTDEWWKGRKLRFCLGSGNLNEAVVYGFELDPEADFDLEVYLNNEELELEITPIGFNPIENMPE